MKREDGSQQFSALAVIPAQGLLGQLAGGCEDLGFDPELEIKLKGGTKRSRFPALKAVLTYPQEGAYANIARTK